MKLPKLLPGESYAAGFRRLGAEVGRLHYLERHCAWTGRLRRKVKRMEPVVNAVRAYYRAREEISATRAAAAERETLWARLRFALLTHDRAERAAQTINRRRRAGAANGARA